MSKTPPTEKAEPGRELAAREDNAGMMELIEQARHRGMPISTLFLAHPGLRRSAMEMAQAMANARGMIGPHLTGQTAACFAIMTKSLQWGLDAFEVAQATYATPGGAIGYFGRLVHAVMDSHPRVEKMMFEDIGDWSILHGKFAKKAGKKQDANGEPIYYMAPTWTPADEIGLGVRVWAKFKDGTEGERLEVWLAECNPRNATTWPTRPRLQIRNVAIRAYANMIDPSLFMGTRIDDTDPDFGQHYGPENAKDVTPKAGQETAGERKSSLDQFAERHGNGEPDGAAEASESPQDEREPETTDDADQGEIDASATPDGAEQADLSLDVDDIEVECRNPAGQPVGMKPTGEAEEWIAKSPPKVIAKLLETNAHWVSGLPAIRQKALRALIKAGEG